MHTSVMLKESIKYLNLKEDSIVVDCTLGYAGHSSEILKKIPQGFLYAFDQDQQVIEASDKKLQAIGNNFKIVSSNFIKLKEYINNPVDAIFFDLGVSSPQLDEKERGFSFHQDAKLDMRMNQNQTLSAYEVVNDYSLNQLIDIFKKYGEEQYAVSIAKGIIKNRPINTTLELVDVIKNNVPFSYKNEKHPARKVFQAIRIEVNDELNVFKTSLKSALDLINVNGRIAVITFHSLEDKICKEIFKEVSTVSKDLKKLPVIPLDYQPKFKIIGSFNPSLEEINENKRARSAKLRVIERIR